MVGLTPKQKEELNNCIYEYLKKNKLNKAAEQFAEDAGIDVESLDTNKSSINDLLEKKWTSVVRLKK